MNAAVAPRVHRWTVDEYDAAVAAGVFGDTSSIELVNGSLVEVEMSPQSPRHAAAIEYITRILAARCATSGESLRVQLPLVCGPDSEPEPDLAIVHGTAADHRDHHPTSASLVVEVSQSSLRFDEDDKAAVYAVAGVPVYWIVDLVHDVVTVFERPDRERRRYTRSARWEANAQIDGISVSAILGLRVDQ